MVNPGGIIIDGDVLGDWISIAGHAQMRARREFAFSDLAERRVKSIGHRVRIWGVVFGAPSRPRHRPVAGLRT
jgi:hypothetical protein